MESTFRQLAENVLLEVWENDNVNARHRDIFPIKAVCPWKHSFFIFDVLLKVGTL